MVRHIIIWNFADGFTEQQNIENSKKVKKYLENLVNTINGLVSVNVYIKPLPSSNGDIMLDCTFDSEESLDNYQVHPDHVKVKNFVKTVTKDRKCFDFID